MKHRFFVIIVLAIAVTVFLAIPTFAAHATKQECSKSGECSIAGADPANPAPTGAPQNNNIPGPGKKGAKGRLKAHMSYENRKALKEVMDKYKNNPDFQAMQNEIKELVKSHNNLTKPIRTSMKEESKKLAAEYKDKISNAQTDEEKAKLKSEWRAKQKEMAEKRKAQLEPYRTSFQEKMKAIDNKYRSKFPDYFAVIDKMKMDQQNKMKWKGKMKSGKM